MKKQITLLCVVFGLVLFLTIVSAQSNKDLDVKKCSFSCIRDMKNATKLCDLNLNSDNKICKNNYNSCLNDAKNSLNKSQIRVNKKSCELNYSACKKASNLKNKECKNNISQSCNAKCILNQTINSNIDCGWRPSQEIRCKDKNGKIAPCITTDQNFYYYDGSICQVSKKHLFDGKYLFSDYQDCQRCIINNSINHILPDGKIDCYWRPYTDSDGCYSIFGNKLVNFRIGGENHTACIQGQMVLGYYFDGTNCRMVSGFGVKENFTLFKYETECQNTCVDISREDYCSKEDDCTYVMIKCNAKYINVKYKDNYKNTNNNLNLSDSTPCLAIEPSPPICNDNRCVGSET